MYLWVRGLLLGKDKRGRIMRKKKVQTLILDFDGTLIDSHLDIAHAANYTLRKMGRPELPIEQITGYIGAG